MKETILEREMMDGRALATYRRVVLVGLIVLLLGACGQAEEEVPPVASPTHEPTATPTHEPAATPARSRSPPLDGSRRSARSMCRRVPGLSVAIWWSRRTGPNRTAG
jgi:hypothetical protein